MIRIGDPKLISELNELLGRELGRNERQEPVFSWRFSEDMFWPARDTGKKVMVEKEVYIPIIGGAEEKAIMQDLRPEYVRDRQVRAIDQWLIAKWLSPEELILGGLIGHGMGWEGGHKPSHDAIVQQWSKLYPGFDFPALGWRIPTDARLPRSPHDPTAPNLEDTNHFISRVHEQTSMGFQARLADMTKWEVERDARQQKPLEDEIRDGFNAFLNPSPGKVGRGSGGGFVSFPGMKKGWVR